MIIELKDLYQLLIAECRYGYTRNNHLMPDGAYEHVKSYLPLMLVEDKDYALHTAKQLCEECISMQLIEHFYDGEDDENKNRYEALKFIEWLFTFIKAYDLLDWKPYNYQQYLDNRALDDKPMYSVYEIPYTEPFKYWNEEYKKVNSKLISKNRLLDFIVTECLKQDSISYRKFNVGASAEVTRYDFDDLKLSYIVRKEVK